MTPPVTGVAKKWSSGKRKIPSSASACTWRKRAFGAKPTITRCVLTPKTKSKKQCAKRKTCLRPTRGTSSVSCFTSLPPSLESRWKDFSKETEGNTESAVTMATLTMVEAINLALKEEMEKDSRVLLLGEDVGKNGGVFRVTQDLFDIFGEERVIDTPLSESAIVGAAIGMAFYGLRAVSEIQVEGFAYAAMRSPVNNAETL